MSLCIGPQCTREATRGPYCAGHDKQRQRGRRRLVELMERTPGGTEPVNFRAGRQLRAALLALGKRRGLRTERAAWEAAAREWLIRHGGDVEG